MQCAITQLLRKYCLICQLYLLKCVDVGDNPPLRLVLEGPLSNQKRPEIILMTNNNTNNLV